MAPRFVTKPVMKPKFRFFRRGRTFWCEDTESGRHQSLGTKNNDDARLLHARNEAHAAPFVSLQMARVYDDDYYSQALRFGGLDTKVFRGFDQSNPEVVLPETIDRDTRGGGRKGIGEPTS